MVHARGVGHYLYVLILRRHFPYQLILVRQRFSENRIITILLYVLTRGIPLLELSRGNQ